MIDFYTQTICIILVIIISILFVKTLYSHKENFTSNPSSSAVLNPYLDCDISDIYSTRPVDDSDSESNLKCTTLKRALKSRDVLEKLLSLYKKLYFENLNENSDTLTEKINQIKTEIEDLVGTNKKNSIQEIFNNINTEYQNLYKDFLLKKKFLQKKKVDKMKSTETNVEFNRKNEILKNKLKQFLLSLRDYEALSGFTGGKIFKHSITNEELVLVKKKFSGEESNRYSSGTDLSFSSNTDIYYISLTQSSNSKIDIKNAKCLFMDISNPTIVKSVENDDLFDLRCRPNDKLSFFLIHKINNNENYNKHIKLSRNYRPEFIIDTFDTSITYPFYLICPFVAPGYAILIKNKKIFVKEVRNDPYQRFDQIFNSRYCKL